MRYYLAYGSNLNVAQMGHRCPGATIVGVATLPDYRLVFKGSKTGAYLTIEPCVGSDVPVVVWAVSGANERSLDRYEGYPTFYRKKAFKTLVNGITLDTFAYVMISRCGYGRPSDYYMDVCRQGYEHFGFDECYLDDAFEHSVQMARIVG